MHKQLSILIRDYKKFIKAILVKSNTLVLNLYDNKFIEILSKILKMLSIFNVRLLIEIVAIDYPFRNRRFELVYLFRSFNYNFRLFIKCFTKDREGLPTLSGLFASSEWLEREIWDMFGVVFFNNLNLRRILTDYGFKGHPFRKDFPLTGYVEIRYDDSKQIILSEPLELSQEFRFFDFQSAWIQKFIY